MASLTSHFLQDEQNPACFACLLDHWLASSMSAPACTSLSCQYSYIVGLHSVIRGDIKVKLEDVFHDVTLIVFAVAGGCWLFQAAA